MLKHISTVSLFAVTYLTLAFPAFGKTYPLNPCIKDAKSNFSTLCDLGLGTIGKAIQNGITILFIIAVIVTLFFLIWGGIKWITSGGDKTQLETARNTIIAAVIGLILVFSSFFILNITLQFFGLPTATRFDIPRLGKPCTSDRIGYCASGKVCIEVGEGTQGRPIYGCRVP